MIGFASIAYEKQRVFVRFWRICYRIVDLNEKEGETMKKICRICIALFVSAVMIFGGTNWSSGAVNIVSPTQIVPSATIDLNTTKTTIEQGDIQALRCVVAPSGGTTSFTSSNSSIATVDQLGIITAHSVGTATITAMYSYNGGVYTDTVTITVVPRSTVQGIKNGTLYYIMNYSNGKLMGLQTASDANNTNVHVGDMTQNTRYQWIAEVQSDGKIQFINVYSPTKKCLNVTNGYNLDIYTDSNQSYQKFTVERVNDSESDYDGLYTIKNGNMYLGKSTTNSVWLKSTLSSDCYWSFMAVPKQYAEFFCHEYPIGNELFQTTLNYTYFRNVFNSLNYATSWSYKNNSATAGYNCMTMRDDVFLFSGHGNAGMIAFYNVVKEGEEEVGVCTGSISVSQGIKPSESTATDIKYISDLTANGLNHARAIMYLGCNTGNDYSSPTVGGNQNLVDRTFGKGAHFVLGVTKVICTNHHNNWIQYFLENIEQGYNIEDSIYYANESLGIVRVDLNNDHVYDEDECYTEMPLYTRGDS